MFFTEALELINEKPTAISAYSLTSHVLKVFKPVFCVLFLFFSLNGVEKNWTVTCLVFY